MNEVKNGSITRNEEERSDERKNNNSGTEKVE